MSTSSSVCALCGVTLHLKNNPSKEMFDGDKEISHYEHELALQDFEDMVGKAPAYKNYLLPKKKKVAADFVHESMPNPLFPKSDINPYSPRQQKRITEDSPVQSIDNEVKSKLFFIRQASSSEIMHQINPSQQKRRRDNGTQALDCIGESERFASRFVSINEFPLLSSRSARADAIYGRSLYAPNSRRT
jgi:hypothetical protein